MLDFLSFDMEVEREEMEETSIKMPSHLDNGRFFTLQFHINNCRTEYCTQILSNNRAVRSVQGFENNPHTPRLTMMYGHN